MHHSGLTEKLKVSVYIFCMCGYLFQKTIILDSMTKTLAVMSYHFKHVHNMRTHMYIYYRQGRTIKIAL